jgi:hypothetical protein
MGTLFIFLDRMSLFEKYHHPTTTKDDKHPRDFYEKLGFRFASSNEPSQHINLSVDGGITIEKLKRIILRHTSKPTLGKSFKNRICELGIDYKSVKKLLTSKKVCIIGSVVTQVLLDEKWDVDVVRMVSLELVDVDGDHQIEKRIIVDRFGDEWSETIYSGVFRTPVAIYHPNIHNPNEDKMTAFKKMTSTLMITHFLRTMYDGATFHIFAQKSLIEKRHCIRTSYRQPSGEVIDKFTRLGFAFDERPMSKDPVRCDKSLPFDTLSKLKTQLTVHQTHHFV